MTPPALSHAAEACDRLGVRAPRSPFVLRRLDWRFLLPDPAIAGVACLADPDSSLVRALRTVCGPVIHLGRRTDARRHRLVVVDRASLDSVRLAADAVAPGGWLYAEFGRQPRALRGWLEHPSRCRRELHRLGFDRVVVSWHRPDFERVVEITPLLDRTAGAFAMSRAPVNWRRRVQGAIGGLLHRTGLLPLVVPCFSVLAHRPSDRRTFGSSDLRDQSHVQPPR